jgi:hypothetical protein
MSYQVNVKKSKTEKCFLTCAMHAITDAKICSEDNMMIAFLLTINSWVLGVWDCITM